MTITSLLQLGLTLVAALSIVEALNYAIQKIAFVWRKKAYEDQRRDEYADAGYPILSHPNPGSHYAAGYSDLGNATRPYHSVAVSAQNSYQSCVASMASLTFIAIIALVISIIVKEQKSIKALLLWVELASLTRLFLTYWRGRPLNRAWLNSRIKSEIARMARSITPLLTSSPQDATQGSS